MASSSISIDDIINIIQSLASKFFSGKTPTFYNVIAFAMSVIEKFSATIKKLDSSTKLKSVLDLLPNIIDELVQLNIITSQQANSLKNQINHDEILVQNTIKDIIDLTNQPNLVQFDKWLKNIFRKLKINCSKCPIPCVKKN